MDNKDITDTVENLGTLKLKEVFFHVMFVDIF